MKNISFVIVIGSLSLLGCEDPGKNAPAAQVGQANAPEPSAAPLTVKPTDAETLALNASTAKLHFTGSKVTGSHTGSFGELSGEVILVAGKAEGGSVTLNVDTRSVDVEPEKLENHLRSADFFDVETYPRARFESTSIEKGSSAQGATHTVTGNLTLRGQTKQISFPATITVTDTTATAKSKFSIDRNDFGILYKGMADDLIHNLVVLELDVNVPRKAG